jgi:hypothetical protein
VPDPLVPPRTEPHLVVACAPWRWVAGGYALALIALFLPAYDFVMTGTIGGGEAQEAFLYSRTVTLVPDTDPFAIGYTLGAGLLAVILLAALRSKPRAWMLPVVAALCAAAVVHLAAVGDDGIDVPSPMPRISSGGACSFDRPVDRPPGAAGGLSSPYGLECGEDVIGGVGIRSARSIAAENPQLDSLHGYTLHPQIGVWLLQPLALLGLVVFGYASLRLLTTPPAAIGIILGATLCLYVVLLLHSAGQMR